MKWKRYFLSAIIGCAFMLNTYAYIQPTDTITVDKNEGKQIEEDLNRLLNLWYIKNSVKSSTLEYEKVSAKEADVKQLSDSVLIKRLSEIPSLIELPYNSIIRRYIELYARRSTAPILIGLSDYYFPMFERILDKHNLPLELKYLPIIESALNPRAVSRAGATGIWQFMYSTGRIYHLEINSFVDERRDPERSSEAAAEFLAHLYSMYKDWTLVIAAYNCGPGNVNKAIRRAGGKRDYWDIYPYLPRETRGYVPAFIGAAYLMNYYDKHNIKPIDIKMPVMTDTIMITKKLHLMQVADVLKIPIEQIRDLNPQYKKDIIPVTTEPYPLRLPLEYSLTFIDLEDSIYSYKDSIYFNPKRVVITPKKYSSRNYYASSYKSNYKPPSTKNKTKLTYTVKSGDALSLIASWYNVRVRDLRYWNNIGYRNKIRVGQKLTVYVPNKKAYTYKKINTMSFDEKNKLVYKNKGGSNINPGYKYDSNYIYHTVKSGENLWTIAQKYKGVSNIDIKKINKFTDEDTRKLKPGQIIKIKKKS